MLDLHEFIEIPLSDIAATNRRSPKIWAVSLSRRVASCSELISIEKMATILSRWPLQSWRASACKAWAAPNAILVASAVFPIPGQPADQQIRGLHATHLIIDVAETEGKAGDTSGTAIGPFRCHNGVIQGTSERDRSAFGAVAGGEIKQRLFARLNLSGAV